MSEPPADHSDWSRQRALWRENHGSWLLALMAGICLVGFSVLAYRQNRFVPPRFPAVGTLQVNRPDAEVADGAATDPESFVVQVRGAVNDSGVMFLAVYDSEESFNDPEQALIRLKQQVTDNEAVYRLPVAALPPRLAIAAFHDQNDDEVLTRNAAGIPTERYGYSNDARGTLGPPPFRDAVIDRPESGVVELVIR